MPDAERPAGTFSQRKEDAMSTQILAPMPGTIVNILVNEGDDVLEYQEVLMLEAMKMENPIPTPRAGKVRSIRVAKGDTVAFEQLLMEID